jgi:hypothetical protein
MSRYSFRGLDNSKEGYNPSVMKRRVLMLVAMAVGAVVLVGLSAAATVSTRSTSAEPSKSIRPAERRAHQGALMTGVVGSPKSTQSSADLADYWTPDRMKAAGPMERVLPGGTAAEGSTSAKVVRPQSEPATKKTAARTADRSAAGKSVSAGSDGVTSSGQLTDDAADFWTPEMMESAEPKQPTVPGGTPPDDTSDSGAVAIPGSGGSTP